jgi:hypothetical protein
MKILFLFGPSPSQPAHDGLSAAHTVGHAPAPLFSHRQSGPIPPGRPMCQPPHERPSPAPVTCARRLAPSHPGRCHRSGSPARAPHHGQPCRSDLKHVDRCCRPLLSPRLFHYVLTLQKSSPPPFDRLSLSLWSDSCQRHQISPSRHRPRPANTLPR